MMSTGSTASSTPVAWREAESGRATERRERRDNGVGKEGEKPESAYASLFFSAKGRTVDISSLSGYKRVWARSVEVMGGEGFKHATITMWQVIALVAVLLPTLISPAVDLKLGKYSTAYGVVSGLAMAFSVLTVLMTVILTAQISFYAPSEMMDFALSFGNLMPIPTFTTILSAALVCASLAFSHFLAYGDTAFYVVTVCFCAGGAFLLGVYIHMHGSLRRRRAVTLSQLRHNQGQL